MGVFSLAGWSRRIHAGFLVSRATQESAMLWSRSNTQLSCSMAVLSSTFFSDSACNNAVLQPRGCRNTRGLGSSPFARHYWGNHSYFLFLQVLRCFSSLRWPPPSGGCCRFAATGCPIRRSAGQGSFAPNRGFSQLITSFLASKSLGIHHVPFSTCSRAGLKPALFARLRFSISCSCLCNMSKIFFQLTTDYR